MKIEVTIGEAAPIVRAQVQAAIEMLGRVAIALESPNIESAYENMNFPLLAKMQENLNELRTEVR